MTDEPDATQKKRKLSSFATKVLAAALIAALIPLLGLGYIFAGSPGNIRSPKIEHLHFRMQIVVDGKAVDFSEEKYQQDYAKDQCSADLPNEPIHFHDKKDQVVHIHWQNVTGGQVLKYYGWSQIGGISGALGYRFDGISNVQHVGIHGDVLPKVSESTEYYAYSGDENDYKERSIDDFRSQDLEKFFGKTSTLKQNQTGLWDKLFPKAAAHGEEVHIEDEEEKLTRVNNLIGNVVIFAQDEKPTDEQIKERFKNLEPLSDSTCGG